MLAKIIIHGGIENIAVQPVLGGLPNFSNKDALWLFLLHRLPKCAPESIVDLASNVQTPTINVKFSHPIAPYLAEIILHLRVAGVGFGHHTLIAEAFIGRISFRIFRFLHGKLKMVKPVFIFRGFTITHYIVKGEKIPPYMVEYAINNNTHSPCMTVVDQLPKILIRAEAGIDVMIIQQIVFMVLPCCKNWIQVYAGSPQFLNIIQILNHTA